MTTREPASVTARTAEPAVRVSTLELFFDLVFVFTVTQLTGVLVRHLAWTDLVQVLLMLVLIWWMYSGYAWLTNAVAPNSTARRTLLLTGMGGFLVIALAIPEAFGVSGWAFGLAYLTVNLVHSVLFARADNQGIRRALQGMVPLNFLSATLVAVGGFLPGPLRYGLWVLAVAVQFATPYLHRMSAHSVIAGHFVERHGLVVIVAIGESIVAIGLGFAGLRLDLGVIAVAVLGLCVAYYLWWTYFAGANDRAEHVLDATTDLRRKAMVALRAWGYAHYPMILGIIVLSAGVKKTVGHAFDPLAWGPAVALGAGTALFMLGHAWFLRILRLGGVVHRLGAAAGLLLTIPLGHLYAVAQLIAVPLVMATALIIEDLPRVRRARSTAIHTFGRTASGPSGPA